MLQLRGHAGFIVWIVFVFGPNAVEYTPVCTLELWEVDITPTLELLIYLGLVLALTDYHSMCGISGAEYSDKNFRTR